MSLLRIVFLTALVAFMAVGANAATFEYTIPAPDATQGDPPVGVEGDSPDGWGSGSWQAGGNGKAQFYLPLGEVFGELGGQTIGDLTSMSFWTKKGSGYVQNPGDWFLNIYTKPYEGSPGSGWYGNRFNAEPYYSVNLDAPAGQWNLWQTGEGENQLRFFDSSDGDMGSYTDLVWDEFKQEFADQEILYMSIGTGNPWAEGFEGLMDGVTLEFEDGSIAKYNFEANPVPVPAAVWLLGSGMVGLLGLRRRQRK
jgi:hypothetical protein